MTCFAICNSCDPPRRIPAEGAVAHLTEHHLSVEDIESAEVVERPQPWEAEGSFIIERYVYEGAKGGTGLQWLVHRVQDGQLRCLRAFKTRKDAVRFVDEW